VHDDSGACGMPLFRRMKSKKSHVSPLRKARIPVPVAMIVGTVIAF
jgi:hypothetical protein